MLDTATIRAFLEDHHLDLASDVAAIAARRIAPLPPPEDDDAGRRQALEILGILGKENLYGYAIPESYGGLPGAPDLRACCLIRERLAAASPLADDIFALQCLGSMPITLAGTEEQRHRYLPEVSTGRAMAAFAMTEPEAGSDVSAMTTTARRDGGEWILSGRKHFISNAGLADFYTVFAVTDPEAGHRGISCFLVEADAPGLEYVGPQILSSPHPLGELLFDDCRLPSEALLGIEGGGFKLGMGTLDRLRATVAAAACGMASRALEEALSHSAQRKQFGKALGEFQLVQQKLARMATDLTASRLLTFRAARQADQGAERVTLESAMAKLFATESAQRVVDDAVQILGGAGVLASSPVDRLYRSVRALRIYEGTSEVQHLIIARQIQKAFEAESRS
ncbi:MAG: acyl-CoA dehydrogenase family protein [Deltaproteobacteria bacterium]|nr:acyl-CoA dehydrogenase family protein [Deltaproteobacteria bacterium]